MAHRASYIINIGEIEPGYVVDHICLNKMCVNPAHLEKVTSLENAKRMHIYHKQAKEIQRLRQILLNLGRDPDADLLALRGFHDDGDCFRSTAFMQATS